MASHVLGMPSDNQRFASISALSAIESTNRLTHA